MSATSPRTRRCERGGALAVMLITLVPVVAVVTTFHTRSIHEIQLHADRKDEMRATMRALAAIEIARNEIINSLYTSGNNDRILQALNQTSTDSLRPAPGGGFYAFDTRTGARLIFNNTDTSLLDPWIRPYRLFRTTDMEDDINGETDDGTDKVSSYVASLTNGGLWHIVEAEAQVGRALRTTRVLIRERDPFTRFSIFIDNHYQGVSGAPKGDIHTNRTLQVFFGGGEFDDFVSARDGFEYVIGASAENTTFNGGSSSTAGQIAMPDLNDIQAIKPHASGPFLIDSTHDQVSVVFNGDQVTIQARNISTGTVETLHNGDLPANGVIYAMNDIVELQGDLNGRCTVASEGDTTVTGSLRYVDEQGDPMRLNPDTPSNYIPNPDYEGSSALGVIANGPVLYSHGIPDIFEIHAAVFSSTGNVGLPGLTFTSNGAYATGYDVSFQKLNMLNVGTTIADKRFVGTVVDWNGNVLSGFRDGVIEYDRDLLNNPPPHFLEIDRPLFKSVEILENVVDV